MEELNKALTLDILDHVKLQTIETQLESLDKEELKDSCKALAKLHIQNQRLIKHFMSNELLKK